MLSHLKEADEVGEDEEGGGVIDPLEEAEEDEGAAIDEEACWEDCLDAPDGQVLAHQGA